MLKAVTLLYGYCFYAVDFVNTLHFQRAYQRVLYIYRWVMYCYWI